MEKKPILCLDFDGVIHSYSSGWKGADVIPDPPVPGAIAFLAEAVQHFRVAILSSRSNQKDGIAAMSNWLRANCDRELDKAPDWYFSIEWPIEKPAAMITLDDRALTFNGTWPSMEELKAFHPWNKKKLDDDAKFTLDDLQKEMQNLAQGFKASIVSILEKGAKANLDMELMTVIFEREMEKLQQ